MCESRVHIHAKHLSLMSHGPQITTRMEPTPKMQCCYLLFWSNKNTINYLHIQFTKSLSSCVFVAAAATAGVPERIDFTLPFSGRNISPLVWQRVSVHVSTHCSYICSVDNWLPVLLLLFLLYLSSFHFVGLFTCDGFSFTSYSPMFFCWSVPPCYWFPIYL